MWTEVVNPNYYAAFAWALLDSIADTTAHPPKLRPLREIRCVTKLDNEMVCKYFFPYLSVDVMLFVRV
jgi:hypothetical protein